LKLLYCYGIYLTGGNPVKKIAESGKTDSATVIISGLSMISGGLIKILYNKIYLLET